jgi:hypothetical protein
MKPLPRLVPLFLALISTISAASLVDSIAAKARAVAKPELHITAEALIVTKAELRRHMAASEDDAFRPATYRELDDARGPAQPNYLVVRFRTKTPGHYSGEAEARINGAKHGTKLNVMLHYNQGWVEYFIPMDSVMYGPPNKEGSPKVAVIWNSLETK